MHPLIPSASPSWGTGQRTGTEPLASYLVLDTPPTSPAGSSQLKGYSTLRGTGELAPADRKLQNTWHRAPRSGDTKGRGRPLTTSKVSILLTLLKSNREESKTKPQNWGLKSLCWEVQRLDYGGREALLQGAGDEPPWRGEGGQALWGSGLSSTSDTSIPNHSACSESWLCF